MLQHVETINQSSFRISAKHFEVTEGAQVSEFLRNTLKLQRAQQTPQGAERIHQIESAKQWADELKEGTQPLGRR